MVIIMSICSDEFFSQYKFCNVVNNPEQICTSPESRSSCSSLLHMLIVIAWKSLKSFNVDREEETLLIDDSVFTVLMTE